MNKLLFSASRRLLAAAAMPLLLAACLSTPDADAQKRNGNT